MIIGGRSAVVLGPVPGGQVSTNVYLTAGDRLYRVNYYAETLDAVGTSLIESMRFDEPARTVESLGLSRELPKPASLGSISFALEHEDPCDSAVSIASVTASEAQLANGCWAQPGDFFIQTTHSRDANGTGWSRMGTPNFWGERTHGDWGLGRCVSNYYTNDLYAIDYYLREGDRLFSPFRAGYVQYAGWDPENWWNYGIMVVIASPNGKSWSLSAHLSAANVVAGQYVDEDTLIGWAGSTGYAAPYPHVHQVFYRWASSSFGRPYGGQGLKQTKLDYLGNGGGAYTTFAKDKWASW
jgi:hypothetical protein